MSDDIPPGFRAPAIIRITSDEGHPVDVAKRKLNRVNLGTYCSNEGCRQFIALHVVQDDDRHSITIEGEPAGSPIWIKCPMCASVQSHPGEAFREIDLTERSKQRPPRH